jgi:hypothetical protein
MAEKHLPIRGFREFAGSVDLPATGTESSFMRHQSLLCRSLLLLLPLAAGPWTGASAAPMDSIYLCVDADGHKTYQNSGEGLTCRRVDGVVATIPSSDLGRGRGARPVPARPVLTPASFPRVDLATQRTRDSDRRRILEDEMRSEQERLAHLRGEFNQGHPQPVGGEAIGSDRYLDRVQHLADDIERSEANIASLRRELTPFRY